MTPLVDMHCHLLAGLDDGPGSLDEAVRMCQRAWDDGIRSSVCLAHMTDRWPDVTPQRIRAERRNTSEPAPPDSLAAEPVPGGRGCRKTRSRPTAGPRGWMGISDRSQYVLLEIPYNSFVDIRDLVKRCWPVECDRSWPIPSDTGSCSIIRRLFGT